MSSRTPASPKNLVEFQTRFGSEKACHRYLENLRWPAGFTCPKCSGREAFRLVSRALLQCKKCRRQSSVTAGTLMHRTKLPLRYWFWTLLQMGWHKRGVSAKQVQRDLDIGSYRTAWLLCHKIREAMGNRPVTVEGIVQLDDAYVGGVKHKANGTGTGAKTPIVVLVEEVVVVKPQGNRCKPQNAARTTCGDCAIQVVSDRSAAALEPAICSAVKPKSLIKSDAWVSYNGLGGKGYWHHPGVAAFTRLPLADRVISNLKRWLLSTHGGRQDGRYLQRYINEFVYKFNRRNFVPSIFERLARRAMKNSPFTGSMLREQFSPA